MTALVRTTDGKAYEGEVTYRPGCITVTGWRRHRNGADWRRVEYVAEGSWTFPWQRVLEIRDGCVT
jgi:hypothetical protein